MTEVKGAISDAITDAILAGIVTISADAIICIDKSQCIIFFNEGAESIFGYSAGEIMGQPLERLIPQRFRSAHASHVRGFGESSVRARKMGERGQILGLRKSGEEFPAEAAISHLGSRSRMVYSVVLRDVTDRLRAHETQQFLAEAGEVLSSSLGPEAALRNVAQLAVPRLADACLVNAFHGGRFQGIAVEHIDPVRATNLERERLEHPLDPAGDHPVAEVIRTLKTMVWSDTDRSSEVRDRALLEVSDIFERAPSTAIVIPLIAREQLLGVMSLYRRKGSYGDNDVFLAEELGRRAALAIDNARLYDLVYAGIRARDDMIGIVSHDLRNPVNAVRMLTGVMLDRQREEPLPTEMVEYAEVIRQAAEQMDSLIRDLLDVTRVEAGKLSVDATRENTEELLSDALRTLVPVASDKSLRLRLTAPDDLPDVLADRERVAQALSNLVGNAVKFSPPGDEIIVRVAVLDGELVFSVSDKGKGMNPEQLSHAFDRFWQSSRTDRQGAGLGLAITKGIIEAHGGRIWAESMPGSGSTFYFTLRTA
ncbi:MAG: ATP-binding protein [Gemmatimonadales bacterium]